MKLLISSFIVIASLTAQSALLTYDQGSKQLDGVNLNPVAKINNEQGQPTDLKMDLLGAGLRSKTVLFVSAKVYVAQLFSDAKATFSRDANALNSLTTDSKMIAMKLSLLRSLPASQLAVSFREAIEANGIAIDAELSQLLKLIETSADAASGKSVTMLMIKNKDGGTNIYYEDVNGTQKSFVGSSELSRKVMAIWLGKPADQGLADLKAQLIKPVY